MGEFVFVKGCPWKKKDNDPLGQARIQFLNRDFDGMIKTLEPVLLVSDYSEAYKRACTTNLAMAYHVRGHHDEALRLYDKCDTSIMKQVNFYACCHRYFEYTNIQDMPYNGKLMEILEHNRLNYILNTNGADEAISFWNDRKTNMFDEQILNEIKVHRGIEIDISNANRAEREYLQECDYSEINKRISFDTKLKIGIFVTDLQRHKNSAVLYQLVDELSAKYEIIIYFNNIFRNKLIKSFEERCQIRYVANISYKEINNLLTEDEILILIDTAEYGLRNSSVSLCLLGNRRILLSQLMKVSSLLIKSCEYFPKTNNNSNGNVILILGDLRYITDSDLNYLIGYSYKNKIVFESHALDEPVFMVNFHNKLIKKGFNMRNTELKQGVLPFISYMQYISSVQEIVLIQGATIAEISEAVQSGVPYKVLSDTDYTNRALIQENRLVDVIDKYIESLKSFSVFKVESDWNFLFYENGRYYCVNCTCNGDLLIFDDVVENRDEYIGFV